jgi:hypothetical protein
LVIGLTAYLYTQLVTTSNHRAIANSQSAVHHSMYYGRATTHAVSRRLPTAATRVRARVR